MTPISPTTFLAPVVLRSNGAAPVDGGEAIFAAYLEPAHPDTDSDAGDALAESDVDDGDESDDVPAICAVCGSVAAFVEAPLVAGQSGSSDVSGPAEVPVSQARSVVGTGDVSAWDRRGSLPDPDGFSLEDRRPPSHAPDIAVAAPVTGQNEVTVATRGKSLNGELASVAAQGEAPVTTVSGAADKAAAPVVRKPEEATGEGHTEAAVAATQAPRRPMPTPVHEAVGGAADPSTARQGVRPNAPEIAATAAEIAAAGPTSALPAAPTAQQQPPFARAAGQGSSDAETVDAPEPQVVVRPDAPRATMPKAATSTVTEPVVRAPAPHATRVEVPDRGQAAQARMPEMAGDESQRASVSVQTAGATPELGSPLATAPLHPMAIQPKESPAAVAELPPLHRQLAEGVLSIRGSEAVIRLAPEELGAVAVRISRAHGQVTVEIVAERAETIDLMRRHAGMLIADLADQGMPDVRLQIGVAPPAERATLGGDPGASLGQGQQQAFSGGGAGGGGDARGQPDRREVPVPARGHAPQPAVAEAGQRLASQRLDLRV